MQNTQFTMKIALILAVVSVSIAQPLSEFKEEVKIIEEVEIMEVSITGVENTDNDRQIHHAAKYHVRGPSFSKTSDEEVGQLYDALRRSYEINQKLTSQLGLFYRMNPIVNGDMPMF